MSDLSSMIDDTTERHLRKIDNWEIPQSDKKYTAIEKEVWESTLNRSMVLEAENAQLKEILETALSWLPDCSKFRAGRYAQLQNVKRKIKEALK